MIRFLRGDANADGSLGIEDALTTLTGLYIDSNVFRCRAASDSDGDGRLDLSDPIHFLSYRFLGTAEPPAPFPNCGPADDTGLPCAESGCR